MAPAKITTTYDPREIVPVPVEELDRLVRFARLGLLVELYVAEKIGDPEASDAVGDAEQRAAVEADLEGYGALLREILP